MLRTDAVAIAAAPKTPDNQMRLNRSGMMTMSKRQAAILAAKLRHPAGKAIPPSPEVQRWADHESRGPSRVDRDGHHWN